MANTARLAVMACLMRGGCDASTTSPGTRGYDNSAANGSIPSSATGHDTGLHFVLGGCTSLLPIVQRNSQKRLADLAVLHHLGQVLCFLCALLPMLCAEPHNRCPLRKRVPRVCARDQRGLAVPMHDRCYCSCGSRPLYGTSSRAAPADQPRPVARPDRAAHSPGSRAAGCTARGKAGEVLRRQLLRVTVAQSFMGGGYRGGLVRLRIAVGEEGQLLRGRHGHP